MKLENSKFKNIKETIKLLSKKDKTIITILGLIAIISFSILIVRLYFFYTKIEYQYTNTFKEGLIEQPVNINPLTPQNDSDRSISQLIYSGLLKQDKKLEYQPDLIKDLPTSTGNNNFKVCLKDNIYWHNNEKLSVDDVVFTFSQAEKIKNLNPKYSLINFVDVTKIDNKCLNIKSELDKNQLYNILTLGIIPKHIWGKINISKADSEFNIKPVGTGMFKFDSLAKNQEGKIVFYKLKRYKKYYNKKPYIKELQFDFYQDLNTAYKAIQNKKINALSTNINPFDNKPEHIKNYQFKWDFYNALFFNLDNNLLQDQSLRKALAYLTPKKEILQDKLNYTGKTIKGPLLPSSYFYNPKIPEIKYNKDKAINILKENGWNKNQNGFWQKNDQIVEFSIKTVNKPSMVRIAKAIQKAWQDIGLRIKLITIPSDRMKKIIIQKDFDSILYGILPGQNTGLFSMWHSNTSENSTLNITNLDSREIDGLLEKAIITKDLKEKKDYYNEFQISLFDLCPAIFLYNTNYNYFVDKDIKGIGVKKIEQTEDRFIGIENWYNTKTRVWK